MDSFQMVSQCFERQWDSLPQKVRALLKEGPPSYLLVNPQDVEQEVLTMHTALWSVLSEQEGRVVRNLHLISVKEACFHEQPLALSFLPSQ